MSTNQLSKRVTKEEWRKKKELDEARKAGTAEAEKDESGKDINPHIPLYITKAPWYLNKNEPTLSHQRPQHQEEEKVGFTDEIKRGQLKNAPIITKWRKGSCQNCGSMTHAQKDCVDRPRKRGAKFTNEDIQPDELIVQNSTTYDGKRDRWNNYDPSDQLEQIREHELLEKSRQQKSIEKNKDNNKDNKDDMTDEYRANEEEGIVQKLDTKTRTTVRHLRIREDTAKYLYNLDLESAFYDPKTRSMRDNPNPHIKPEDQVYSGDNFTRITGDAKKFNEFRAFTWDAYEKGQDIHNVAAPSSAETLFKETKEKNTEKMKEKKNILLEKYGGGEHLKQPPKELIYGQQEVYVEYSRDGNLIHGTEKEIPKSKYEEDVYINNHKSVWGSFWHEGSWGFACCHQLIKNCYCTGETGKKILNSINHPQVNIPKKNEDYDEDEMDRKESSLSNKRGSSPEKNSSKKKSKKKSKKEKKEKKKKQEKKKREKKLREGLERLEQLEKEGKNGGDERKKKFNSLNSNYNVTDEEMEIYRMNKRKFEDPMNRDD